MHILIIGYGTIGKIKAPLWQDLGCTVLVYDKDPSKQAEALSDGYNKLDNSVLADNEFIIDISTPAGKHYDALIWALSNLTSKPKLILVEKPLASSLQEIHKFAELDLHAAKSNLFERIYVNETYYSSKAIQFISDIINKSAPDRMSIAIELSKNRLADTDSGRFIDTSLQSVGIEVPHMLAILECLNIDFDTLLSGTSSLIVDNKREDNQAFLFSLNSDRHAIALTSYLGDFRIVNNTIQPFNTIIRTVQIETTDSNYIIEFDPVPDMPRYHSRITINGHGQKSEELIMVDDHLKNHMQQFLSVGDTSNSFKHLHITNALKISDILLKLKRSSTTYPKRLYGNRKILHKQYVTYANEKG